MQTDIRNATNNDKSERALDKTAVQAKSDAQKIAFGPIVFQAVVAMQNLGIFDILLKHKRSAITPEEIADQLDIGLYGVNVLLEVCLKSEIVAFNGTGYTLTKTGYFLARDELTSVNINFVNDVCYQGMFFLTESIKELRPAGLKTISDMRTIYEALSTLPPKIQKSWFDFDQYYSDVAFPEALPIVFSHNPKHVLDVGGNTGKWAIQCCKFDKQVNVTIVDLPGQLKKAAENVGNNNLDNRIHLLACDLLKKDADLPGDMDVIWMSQFLDCFSEEEIVDILKFMKTRMSDTTSLFIMELFWDRQRFEAAAFSLVNTSLYFTCLANGNSKIYGSKEFIHCIEKAGLRIIREHDNIGSLHTLLECKI